VRQGAAPARIERQETQRLAVDTANPVGSPNVQRPPASMDSLDMWLRFLVVSIWTFSAPVSGCYGECSIMSGSERLLEGWPANA
jgi:hypothetical protein